MSARALEIADLHTHFFTAEGVTKAVSGVTLNVDAGTMVGIVGESGAGKTTLATSVMCAVRAPGRVVSGETRVYGRDLQAMTADELTQMRGKEIAMIVPNPRAELNPFLTVGAQIEAVARAHLRLSKGDARDYAIEMLKKVRIPDPARRARAHPHELSGGMAQRVVIAMALAGEPKVLISDDATSGLDVTVQAQVLDLTAGLLRDRDAASLMITRDLGIVANYCDSVVVLYRGQVVEQADLRSFFAAPRHPYSIDLLAAFSYEDDAVRFQPEPGDFDGEERPLCQVGPNHYVREF